MKKTIVFLVLSVALLAMSPFRKTHILFFGDSITQAGVNPGGYITRIQRFLDSTGKAGDYQLTGAGIGGNKIYDLYLRLEDDVLSKKPDIVFIYVGVNDVWHKSGSGTGTDADKFEKFYTALVKKIQAQNIQVILCTPATIGEKWDNTNQQDGDLNAYSKIIARLATSLNCKLVDLRTSFMDYNKQHNPDNKEKGILTTDRVHLNELGNQRVANEMMKVLGWVD